MISAALSVLGKRNRAPEPGNGLKKPPSDVLTRLDTRSMFASIAECLDPRSLARLDQVNRLARAKVHYARGLSRSLEVNVRYKEPSLIDDLKSLFVPTANQADSSLVNALRQHSHGTRLQRLNIYAGPRTLTVPCISKSLVPFLTGKKFRVLDFILSAEYSIPKLTFSRYVNGYAEMWHGLLHALDLSEVEHLRLMLNIHLPQRGYEAFASLCEKLQQCTKLKTFDSDLCGFVDHPDRKLLLRSLPKATMEALSNGSGHQYFDAIHIEDEQDVDLLTQFNRDVIRSCFLVGPLRGSLRLFQFLPFSRMRDIRLEGCGDPLELLPVLVTQLEESENRILEYLYLSWSRAEISNPDDIESIMALTIRLVHALKSPQLKSLILVFPGPCKYGTRLPYEVPRDVWAAKLALWTQIETFIVSPMNPADGCRSIVPRIRQIATTE
jgi:hypothetical protein